MLEDNKDWGKKVKIVGVSVDEDYSHVRKFVKQQKCELVEHLSLQKWDYNHKLISDFAIDGIPFICLVDTEG